MDIFGFTAELLGFLLLIGFVTGFVDTINIVNRRQLAEKCDVQTFPLDQVYVKTMI